MKTIKTINGIRRIEDCDANVTLIKVREILSEHRGTFITRLVSDLNSYIDYKFSVKPTSIQMESVKDRLFSLRNSGLDLEKYDSVFQNILSNENTYIPAEPFYKEIDEQIGSELNSSQLTLVG